MIVPVIGSATVCCVTVPEAITGDPTTVANVVGTGAVLEVEALAPT